MKLRVVVDFPVEEDDEVIRVGRFIFRKCDECPLTTEEVAVTLILDGLSLGFGEDFEVVGLVDDDSWGGCGD